MNCIMFVMKFSSLSFLDWSLFVLSCSYATIWTFARLCSGEWKWYPVAYEQNSSQNHDGHQGYSSRRSVQRIVIFPANRNRNRFAEPTSVRIGIGIVREFQNLRIGIGIIFVRWEVFANCSRIPEIYFFFFFFLLISFIGLLYIFI